MHAPAGIGKVFLIGLMGSGKSTVGKILADILKWEFLDIDHEIETFAGCDIPSIFEDQGEDGFRDYESQVLSKTSDLNNAIIACGGGIVTREENVDFLQDHMTVWLDVSPAEAAARLENATDRPLLSECKDTLKKLNEILQERMDAYTAASFIQVKSDGRPPEHIASEIVKKLELIHD